MSNDKTFSNITPELFNCIKESSKREHGTVYEPPNANQGTSTTKVKGFGTIVLSFDFNPTAKTLYYKKVKKRWSVPMREIWKGISKTIQGCS